MTEQLTHQQQEAVNNRGGKLLVSAAAGSGKTKVLVDRLLGYLSDPTDPANVDDFLIITYTKAAAAELRGKIASKISQQVAEDPENRHLQQQMQRLYLAKISTVHSFCTDILREYAYYLDLSADFRVADENECFELQSCVLEKILEEAYATADDDPDFCAFLNSQGLGRDDRQIPEILLKVYRSAMCHLNPREWLEWCMSSLENTEVKDVSQTVWGSYLLEDLHNYLDLQINAMQRCADRAAATDGMDKPAAVLGSTVDQLVLLRNSRTWTDIQKNMGIDYGRLTFSKNCSNLLLAEQIKTVREACKKGIASRIRRFSGDNEQVLGAVQTSANAARGLMNLIRKFSTEYDKYKRSRRVLDFSDLEHKTLDLLLGKHRSGVTVVAKEIGLRFREVMVDEYQDSNAVQDAIFSALTMQRQNCFMVGDVKQSIYQFRLADPGIFLEKYNCYSPASEAIVGQGRKVLLNSNFRSSGGVIAAVNDVFSTCMSPKIGGLIYDEDEQLKEGVPHIPLEESEVVLYGVDVVEDTYAEESAFVAEKIAQLLDGKHYVRQGEELRPITADDIVILLRSPGSVGNAFQYALEERGIACATGGSQDLLHTEEIEVLRSMLQIISNPLQDIPLISVLMSRVFCFTADDLALIRRKNKYESMYAALQEDRTDKSVAFLEVLNTLRQEAQLNSLSGLLNRIFSLTRIDSIYASMPDGTGRLENIQNFCQVAVGYESAVSCSLGQFLEHLDMVDDRGLSAGGELSSCGAVRIMSIHKSKGLEFPVVFLCGLSRDFNRDNARAQVLCDRELGLGLTCVDMENRVRYPTIAKHAIAAKINADSLSEEMRVLYVAMTRARDRLFMTYAAKNIADELNNISLRVGLCGPLLMSQDVNSPGDWVLLTAQMHQENGWSVEVVRAPVGNTQVILDNDIQSGLPDDSIDRMRKYLNFKYVYDLATSVPSKLTATQLKGREKDREVAQNAAIRDGELQWREPSFVETKVSGSVRGSAMHAVMQHINYYACAEKSGVEQEIARLVKDGCISAEQAKLANVEHITAFFTTEIGTKLRSDIKVLREFKFSILDDASKYYPGTKGEKILLQGVVDCAMIESDGITVIDFKTDRVTDETLPMVIERYTPQICTYADALSRIYCLPVKAAKLYFFDSHRMVDVI